MTFVIWTLYTVIVTVLLPFIMLRILVRNVLDRDGHRKAGPRYRVLERFGICLSSGPGHNGVIFHAVSVGESLAVIDLIKRYVAENPSIPVTVTCSTQTASNLIRQRLAGLVHHRYMPIDHPVFINLFLSNLKPRAVVLLETEMWPSLTKSCASRGIKMVFLNARMSQRSFEGYKRILPVVKDMLESFSQVCCQTERDAQRFIDLGLRKEKCLVTGNLKFDIQIDPSLGENAEILWGEIMGGRPCWICASTHEGEEEILLGAHKILSEQFPDLVMILAPRRPQRTHLIVQLVEQKSLRHVCRTENRKIHADENVFILDTIGELMSFYAMSQVCFVGGSLSDTGGHNPLEPAILSKPILSGQNVDNFNKIYNELESARAVYFVQNEEDVARHTAELISNRELAKTRGENAKSYLINHRGASQLSLNVLSDINDDRYNNFSRAI